MLGISCRCLQEMASESGQGCISLPSRLEHLCSNSVCVGDIVWQGSGQEATRVEGLLVSGLWLCMAFCVLVWWATGGD